MNKNPLNKGRIEENSDGIGQVSTDMVAQRAGDLALIAGRPVTLGDCKQAVRELTGGDGMDAEQTWIESIPEEDRWNPIPGSMGSQAEESASEEEDEEGQGKSAQLFEEGVNEAAHDQMLQAAIAVAERSLHDS